MMNMRIQCLKYEGPKWDVSSCSSSSEYLGQEERSSLDFIENISYEMYKEEQGWFLALGMRELSSWVHMVTSSLARVFLRTLEQCAGEDTFGARIMKPTKARNGSGKSWIL